MINVMMIAFYYNQPRIAAAGKHVGEKSESKKDFSGVQVQRRRRIAAIARVPIRRRLIFSVLGTGGQV